MNLDEVMRKHTALAEALKADMAAKHGKPRAQLILLLGGQLALSKQMERALPRMAFFFNEQRQSMTEACLALARAQAEAAGLEGEKLHEDLETFTTEVQRTISTIYAAHEEIAQVVTGAIHDHSR